MRIFRRKHQPVDTAESREAVQRANRIDALANFLIDRERRIIRDNHLGPRIRSALKEQL